MSIIYKEISGRSVTNIGAIDLIASRVQFKANSMAGVIWASDNMQSMGFGRLDYDLVAQMGHEQPDYVVYSYGTPIAWHHVGGWSVPSVRYSVTTSKHQGIVRRAVFSL